MTRRRSRAVALLALLGASACGPAAPAAEPAALSLEARIPLGLVKGRIDHLAEDAGRGRLFVAELGNGSVGVVDLGRRQAIARIDGLSEPQGLGYAAGADQVYVASGGDGSVRVFAGVDFKPVGRIDLGADADNVRVEAKSGRVLIGYGEGALAIIDPRTRSVTSRIPLPAHPESFQLGPSGPVIYVNLPRARRIAVVDRVTGGTKGSLPTGLALANFPMALDSRGRRLAVVFRAPPELRVFDLTRNGAAASLGVCGDADDVFFDERRDRLYVICGQGVVDVVAPKGADFEQIGRIPTAPGARTGLWSPSADRLYVAAPARSNAGAAVLIFRPEP
jgi:DNA-binding beta-propeller fold protein YncE